MDSEVVRGAARLLTLVIPAQAGIQTHACVRRLNVTGRLTSLSYGIRRNDATDAILFVYRVPKTKIQTRLPLLYGPSGSHAIFGVLEWLLLDRMHFLHD